MSLVLTDGTVGAAPPSQYDSAATPSTRWHIGDDPIWAQSEFDDSNWLVFEGLSELPKSVFWIREHFTINSDYVQPANSFLDVEGSGAFDIYLDGQLLGSSGAVGETVQQERPGSLRFTMGVPRAFLKPGKHVLAVRASAHNLRDPSAFFITYRIKPANEVLLRSSLNLVMLGAAFAAVGMLAIFFFVSSLASRQKRIFVATLTVAVGVAIITTVETGELLGVIAYPWRTATDLFAMVAAGSIFVALPAMLLMRLSIGRYWFWITGLVLVVLASAPSWGNLNYEHDTRVFISLCAYCLIICAVAPLRVRGHAVYYAASIGLSLVGILIDPNFMFVFLVTLAVLLALSFALDIREQELSVKQAQLTAARLETEMLKRNIQPHFLMNSLTAITEWVETAPKDALRFIHGLADEFRSLSTLSGEKLVRLNDEIELCRTHLQLMGMRHKKRYCLVTKGLKGDEMIPPGIFHTLIENALSHNRYSNDVVSFELTKDPIEKGVIYTMMAPIGKDTGHHNRSTGAGLKYVRSRLEESYPGQWQLASDAKTDQWITKIQLIGI
ncbi:MAG: histidine kinase [Pseudomonadota bacterium]